MKKKQLYNKQYFLDRDHLDLIIAESIHLLMQDHGLKCVLDVGCGSGKLVKFLNQRKFSAFGVDLESQGLKMARKINQKGKIIASSADKLPFKDKTFDLITSISVIEHLTSQQAGKFLKESYRVLSPGGYIFMITPNFNSPMRFLAGKKWFGYLDPTHINFFTPAILSKLLTKTGFNNVKLRIRAARNVNFDWHLPSPLRVLPGPLKNILNYLMISSPLSTLRDSFWIFAHKPL